MTEFALESDSIALPKGAWAKTHRARLRWGDTTILGLTQGPFRPYVYPLLTPAGFYVTSESPADHPHHSSLWVGSDHVHAQMPAASETVEEYTYNFYVNETFQGRAPGRMIETGRHGKTLPDGSFEIVQAIEWRGPREWAADHGRVAALERRAMIITRGERHNRIDLSSQLTAHNWSIKLGPTRHAYFNIRVADSMIVANGGMVLDDRGLSGGAAITGDGARWVDFSGPVGGGNIAGIAVVPHVVNGRTPYWFVADWGVVTVGPFRTKPLLLEQGQSFASTCTIIVHDGDQNEAGVGRIARDIIKG